jgi:hypothetical protein
MAGLALVAFLTGRTWWLDRPGAAGDEAATGLAEDRDG